MKHIKNPGRLCEVNLKSRALSRDKCLGMSQVLVFPSLSFITHNLALHYNHSKDLTDLWGLLTRKWRYVLHLWFLVFDFILMRSIFRNCLLFILDAYVSYILNSSPNFIHICGVRVQP